MRELIGAQAEHGKIRVRIVADEVGGKPASVGERNHQITRPVDDVAVGQQVAIGRDEESRTRPARSCIAPDFDMDNGRIRRRRGAGYCPGIGIEQIVVGRCGGSAMGEK
jgi:hypothetical protein